MYCWIELIIAETAQQIKRLMMCNTLETFALLFVFGFAIDEEFLHFTFQAFPSCGFYYFIIYFTIALSNFLLFVVISK